LRIGGTPAKMKGPGEKDNRRGSCAVKKYI
jgi:hypothetical protein